MQLISIMPADIDEADKKTGMLRNDTMGSNKFEELNETEAMPDVAEDIISNQSRSGTVYDWSTAPDTVKAPPRINLDGKEAVIIKADIILPSQTEPWMPTRDGKKQCKRCPFKLYYDIEGQQEFLSGVRVFKSDDGKYSPPSMTRDGKNQASELMMLYAEYKKKSINDVPLREFMGWLNSKPRVLIKAVETKNPTTGVTVKKNLPAKIVG